MEGGLSTDLVGGGGTGSCHQVKPRLIKGRGCWCRRVGGRSLPTWGFPYRSIVAERKDVIKDISANHTVTLVYVPECRF